jgi:hypothetical protein
VENNKAIMVRKVSELLVRFGRNETINHVAQWIVEQKKVGRKEDYLGDAAAIVRDVQAEIDAHANWKPRNANGEIVGNHGIVLTG